MPVKAANSSDPVYDFACLRRRFRGAAGSFSWTVALRNTTSDVYQETDDEEYWGSDRDWEIADADAPSHDEFATVIQFLRSSGQASA